MSTSPKRNFSTINVSCPEPGCGRPTRVLRTRAEGAMVRRERICSRGHRHETIEKPAKPRKRMTHSEAALKRWRTA